MELCFEKKCLKVMHGADFQDAIQAIAYKLREMALAFQSALLVT